VDALEVGAKVTVGDVVEPEVTTPLLVVLEAVLVLAAFVAGAKAYFVHNPPKTSLQSAG
jgi:hypothetical protein